MKFLVLLLFLSPFIIGVLYLLRKKYHTEVQVHEFDAYSKILKQNHRVGILCAGTATVSWSGFKTETRQIPFIRQTLLNDPDFRYKNWSSTEYEKHYKVPDEVKWHLESLWAQAQVAIKDKERHEFDTRFDSRNHL